MSDKTEQGNNGMIWSSRIRVALALALSLALSVVASGIASAAYGWK